jgi:hypothetical protein
MSDSAPPGRRRDRRALIDAIAAEELALDRLTAQERDARTRLAALRAELDSLDQRASVRPSQGVELAGPRSSADKVALFRRLFRGREDVFPTRFTSKRTGKAGYAPAHAGTSSDEKTIGMVGGGKRRANGQLDVAMIQSLVHHGTVDDLVAEYGQVIVDECHHVPAASCERVLSEAKARYLVGLTATAERRDGHHPIGEMQLGPVRFAVTARQVAARRPFEHRLVVRETTFATTPTTPSAGIQTLYATLARDEARNQLILNDVIAALVEGRSPILLTERTDHLESFAARLAGFTPGLVGLFTDGAASS